VGDVHLRVSTPPLSGFVAVPLAVAHAHNPRVVASNQWYSRVTFLDSDRVGSGDGRPKVSPRVLHLFSRVCDLGIFFNL
jgi:hypothetical protein